MKRPSFASDRFWKHVRKDVNASGCWFWEGSKRDPSQRYISFANVEGGKRIHVARFSYVLSFGGIPRGHDVIAICGVEGCVRPDHLQALLRAKALHQKETTTAAINAAKTHCPKGHPYDEENTYWYMGKRACRNCRRLRPAKK